MSIAAEMLADKETLAAIFASRVRLAKMTSEEAVAHALDDHQKTLRWVASASQKDYSFIWYCELYDLDVGAVRKAIRERTK